MHSQGRSVAPGRTGIPLYLGEFYCPLVQVFILDRSYSLHRAQHSMSVLPESVRYSGHDPWFAIPSTSAMRTNSATDFTCIFRMMLPRWNLIVLSVAPSSSAICLFSMPETTHLNTSRSRGLSDS